MLKEIVGDFGSKCPGQGVESHARPPGADGARPLRQVLYRTDPYQPVAQRCQIYRARDHRGQAFARRGRQLKLEVHDTGIGIDKSYMPHLFQPFSQEDSTTPVISRAPDRFGAMPQVSRFRRRYFRRSEHENVGTTCTLIFRARSAGLRPAHAGCFRSSLCGGAAGSGMGASPLSSRALPFAAVAAQPALRNPPFSEGRCSDAAGMGFRGDLSAVIFSP